MANSYFQFKQFRIDQDKTAMKVTTDACLLGAWAASKITASAGDSILDIGAGTGLLSLMLTQATALSVDALEIEPAAAAQAAANFKSSPWPDRLNIFNTDILHFNAPTRYNVIISNPPFYEKDLRSGMHVKDLAHHDEGLSLDLLLGAIKKFLAPDGHFFLLLPVKRKQALLNLMEAEKLRLIRMDEVRQSTSHAPFRILIRGAHKTESDSTENRSEDMIETGDYSIKDDQQQYTAWFSELLKPYYLYL